MKPEIEIILDVCLDRINAGADIDACLADYPAQAETLRPLLQAALESQAAWAFTPSDAAKREARQRFSDALTARQTERDAVKPVWQRLFGQPKAWIATAAVVAAFLIGFLGVYPNLGTAPVVPAANPEGNFQFLVSDEPNAIDDFNHVYINITKIELQSTGGETNVEITPEISEFDLKPLTGDKALEIWRGDVPAGDYDKVIIHVSDVRGVIAGAGDKDFVEIKLPSNKLQINHAFGISADAVTSFVYDVTVIKAGRQGKYVLKPQIAESGASQPFTEVEAAKPEPNENAPGKGRNK